MNHPDPDTLTDYLFDELDAAQRETVEAHLKECGECATQVQAWKNVRSELSHWTVPQPRTVTARPARNFSVMRWAAAAAVFLGLGYAIAKLAEKPVDFGALRAELAREVRDEVSRELTVKLAGYAAEQESRQSEFQDAVVQAMNRLETRQQLQHASLRQDVEIVALHAQEEIERLAMNEFPATQNPQ